MDFEARFEVLYSCGYQGAFKILGNRADAEEFAQEACARALVRWDQVSGFAEAWVTRAAVNLAIDRWRRASRHPSVELHDTPGCDDATWGLRTDLVRALSQLSGRQRDVVVMRYLVDLPEKEVARVLGCSVGSVKRHASRGLHALRARLADSPAGDLVAGDEGVEGGGGRV